MDPLLWSRAIERLLIVVCAGASLAFGWDLFRRGIVTLQAAEFVALKTSAKLQKVGPGVFFALFGSAILIVCLRSEYQRNDAVTGEPVESYVGQSVRQTQQVIRAANTLESTAWVYGPATQSERTAMSRAMEEITGMRNRLVAQNAGAEAVATYLRNRDKYLANRESITDPAIRKTMEELEPIMTDVFESDVK